MSYTIEEQKNTIYKLYDRVKPYDNEKQNSIIINFDANKLNKDRIAFLQRLSDIINNSGQLGTMAYDEFILEIISLDTYEKENLINKNKLGITHV